MTCNISLQCPDCKGEIQVVSAAGLEEKSATCPHCKVTHKIGEYFPKLSFRMGNSCYQLRFGKQWIGRKSPSGTADIQISDETRYMSKMHAIITVSCTSIGLKCTLEEHGKNPTHLQSVPLMEDDVVYLNVNDCMELGGQKMYLSSEFEQKK